MKHFLIEYGLSLGTLLAGFIAWANERHKRKNIEVDTSQKIIAMYQGALNDFQIRYDLKIKDLDGKVNRLSSEVIQWKKKYLTLKKDFEAYRKKHN